MIPIKIMTQPDDVTCGPTSLHAVYNYFGDKITLSQVISEISYLDEGGTLAVMLGIHSLKRNYEATIYTYNLSVFDPTWFNGKTDIKAKLIEQKKLKKNRRLRNATDSYVEFLSLGGKIDFVNLTPSLFNKLFEKKLPILTGLSATYLYNCSREAWSGNKSVYDDVKGYPTGHFVILSGYDEVSHDVVVADPYRENPVSGDNYYSVKVSRLINSILLGILTFDSNLLVIKPKGK
ncbi:MAG: hypothetical protein U5K00_08555 [Melioribacteraceae bacterium]|nr:hypothetical protein [Melioribacteraceae bacterium]